MSDKCAHMECKFDATCAGPFERVSVWLAPEVDERWHVKSSFKMRDSLSQ